MQIALVGKNRILAIVLAFTMTLNAIIYSTLGRTPTLSPNRPDSLYAFLDNLPRVFEPNWTADNTNLRHSGVGVVSGDVVVRNKTTGRYVPLTTDYEPTQGDTIVSSNDGHALLKLDSDKEIFVDANTILELTEVKIDGRTNGYVTRLMLHEGNVLSSVSKPLKENDIYEVRTPTLDMAIRGTIVHVGYDKTAGSSMVAFLTGRGLVRSNDTDEVVALVAGEQIMQDSGGYVKGKLDGDLLPGYIANSLNNFGELMYNIETVDFSNAYPDDGFDAENYTFEEPVSAEAPVAVPETTSVLPIGINNIADSTNGGGTQGGSTEGEVPTYTVTYNLYDGAQQVDSYTYGKGLALTTSFKKDGYVFKGWFDNSDFKGTSITTISATDSGNKTFWAKWAEKTVTVGEQSGTLTAGTGGRVTYNVTTENIASGTAITLNGIDSVNGASFSGASTTGDSTIITIETSDNTPAGTSPLTLTMDGVTSEQFNLIVLPDVVPVTKITVTGEGGSTQIATRNGTLQMFATVSPDEATNPNVMWSVAEEGRAKISSSGLLTAKANGKVTIRATAVDGSGVYGELQINITGNFIAVSDVTIVSKNATMGIPLDLSSTITIAPFNATNQTIEWGFHQNTVNAINRGDVIAEINDGMLIVTRVGPNGKVSITATIEDAYGPDNHYSKNFDITVNPASSTTRGAPNEIIIACDVCGEVECICVPVCDVCGEVECICVPVCDVCGEVECICVQVCDVCGEEECVCVLVCDVCGEEECVCAPVCDVCKEEECVCVPVCDVCGKREDDCDGTCGTP